MADILIQEDGWSAVDVRPISVVSFDPGICEDNDMI